MAIPWGDNERYDLIAEFNGKFNRIQVKTCNEEQNGSIICYCRSSKNHTTNKVKSLYIGEVDYFVFVNQTHDLIAIVPIEDIGEKTQIALRLIPPRNGVKTAKYFSDYSFEKFFNIGEKSE